MKAITLNKYGNIDNLKYENIDKPSPKDNQVLIEIISSTPNKADLVRLLSDPIIMRLETGIFKPKHKIPGLDIAGIIEETGKDIKEFKKGDEIISFQHDGGAFAEYICLEEKDIVLKPKKATFNESACLPVVGLTALQAINYQGSIKEGDNVLINGASGAVGIMAVQIAKSYGASVTGICSTRKIEYVMSNGADSIIDYYKEDFRESYNKYDLIVDCVGNHDIKDLEKVMSNNSRCVIIGYYSFNKFLKQKINASWKGAKKSRGMEPAKMNKSDLSYLAKLFDDGKIKQDILEVYKLSETAKAIKKLEDKNLKGKLVINNT